PLNLVLNNVRIDNLGNVTAANAGISEISDPDFPFPVAIPKATGVTVTQALAPAPAPADIKSYCQQALGLGAAGTSGPSLIDDTFVNDPGYGLQYFASGTGNPFVIGRRTVTSSANVFNNFGDFTPIPGTGAAARQALVDNTPYTLSYTIERLTATDTRISTAV